jgi:pyruvate dehydrogenase E2 component (dihydrolipoamide acetyltransferase)
LPEDCWVLRAPRLNPNDDAVTLTRWLSPDRSKVAAGQPIAEIETEKATAELVAGAGGILVHVVGVGAKVPVDAPLAYLGLDPAAIDTARSVDTLIQAPAQDQSRAATLKAQALAVAHGVDLARVAASGATIKERDVARYLSEHSDDGNVLADDARLVPVGEASAHQLRVVRDLREAARSGIFTSLAYRLDLRGPERMIASELADGRVASLLVVLLSALGKTLPAFPDLISRLHGKKIYHYRSIDIAFAVRSPAGELHAPVVRHVDRMDVEAIARECARLAKSAMRGKLDAKDVSGACFTVSLIPTPNVESFVALPAPFQTAILALGARRQEIELTAAGAVSRPVATATVTYDHALCDGIAVAQFCEALDRALNPEPA